MNETNFRISLNRQDLNQILNALGKEPYVQVFELIHNLQNQISGQLSTNGENKEGSQNETIRKKESHLT